MRRVTIIKHTAAVLCAAVVKLYYYIFQSHRDENERPEMAIILLSGGRVENISYCIPVWVTRARDDDVYLLLSCFFHAQPSHAFRPPFHVSLYFCPVGRVLLPSRTIYAMQVCRRDGWLRAARRRDTHP